MKRIYISSTIKDLKDYRTAVIDVLQKCGYDVDAMEKYPARDDRPKAASESDAANCDIYVGIFAWCYGHVPAEDNPEKKSITELEYLAAGRAEKPRLVFLLADDAPRPAVRRRAAQAKDEKNIRDLRKRLKAEKWFAFFYSVDGLAKDVLTSVFQHESTKRIEDLEAVDKIRSARELGPSYLPNIQRQVDQLGTADFVALRLGPIPWWDTRLHLTAALASDFTEIQQFVVLDERGRFFTMAAPAEIRRALGKAVPKLEMAYLRSREQASGLLAPSDEVERIILCYPAAVNSVFVTTDELAAKQVVTLAGLRQLGIKPEGEAVEKIGSERGPVMNSDLLRRSARYLVLMREGHLEGVIDRAELASRIARTLL